MTAWHQWWWRPIRAVATLVSLPNSEFVPLGTRALALLIAPCAVIGMATGARILQVASREALQAAMTVLLLAVAALTISKAATD